MRNPLEEKPLRKKAEKELLKKPKAHQKKISSGDTGKLIHELQAHQIELEMQNQELRKAQEEIEKSRSQYVDLYDLAPMGYITLNKTGTIREVNLAGASLLEVKRNSLLKVPFSLFIMPEDRDLFRDLHRKVFQLPGGQSCELRLKRRKKDPFWVRLEGVAVEEPGGKPSGVRLALSDITERKRTEEKVLRLNEELEARVRERMAQLEAVNKALKDEIAGRQEAEQEIRQSEKEFRGIFESSSVGMIERDASTGQRLHVNPRLCEMTGYSAKELLNEKDLILTHPDDRERDQKVKKGVPKGKSTNWASEKRYVRKDGEVIWVHVNGRLIRDSSGRPYRTVAVIQDITERKRAELALQESRALLDAVMSNTSDPVYVKDKQSRIVMCNPALEMVAGKPASEIIGRTDSEYYEDPVIGNALREHDLRVMESGRSQTMEETAKTPDGYRIFISNKAPYRNESGDVIGVIGISHDITERKRAEEALRESEERNRNLVKYAPAAIYEMDLEGTKFLSVNEAMCNILKYSKEELLAIKPAELLAPESRSLFKERIRGKLAGGKIDETVEYRIRRKDGEWIYAMVNVGGFTYTKGKPSRVVVIAYDITERKKIQEALQESEKRYRHLVLHAPAGIYEIDFTTGRFTEVNDVMSRILGYTRDELLAMTAFDILDEEGKARFAARIRLGRAGEQLNDFPEYRVRTKDGRIIWALLNATFRWDGDKIVGASVISHDITARKQAEDELRKAKDELEIRVQERTEELAKSQQRLQQLASQLLLAQEKERKRVAVELHDGLLSELAATKYMLEGRLMLLEQKKVLDPGGLRRVSDILGNAMKEARRIMNNLHPTVLDELGLLTAIRCLCNEYQNSYPHITLQKQIGISEQDISDSIKVVIYRVMQEALNNFAKHGKGDVVDLSLSKSNGTIAFTIRDNGQGFDFEKAQRGLGLESMRERVEISGGHFQIESVIGQGTTIRAIWNI